MKHRLEINVPGYLFTIEGVEGNHPEFIEGETVGASILSILQASLYPEDYEGLLEAART